MCTTPSITFNYTCGVFVKAESLLVSRHPTRSDPTPVSVSQMKTMLGIFMIFELEEIPDVTFSENPTCGSRLGCIHEGQSETFNEGKQRGRNTYD